jgi:hypothetical protein
MSAGLGLPPGVGGATSAADHLQYQTRLRVDRLADRPETQTRQVAPLHIFVSQRMKVRIAVGAV